MKYILPLLLCFLFIGCGQQPWKRTEYHPKGSFYWKVEGKTFYDRTEAHEYAKDLCRKENRMVEVKHYTP